MRILLIKKARISGSLYELSDKEYNYLKNSLRLSEGTSFKAKDEGEILYDAILDGRLLIIKKSDDASYLDSMPSFTGHFQKIHLYQATLKGKKNERVIRDSQEAGCEKITFFSSSYSEGKITKHDKERFEAIRREAVQQSGARVMEIGEETSFSEAIRKAEGRVLILHQSIRGRTKSIKEALFATGRDEIISLFIGPEGGFSDEECSFAEEKGALPVLLKTNILRAENASIYTVAAVQTLLNE